ncbi:MAG TPA: alpha/beta fold hydrolase, partial [Ramlibacter sp.]|nr:alpha/beta fold hydrolase [Ramlibacter sp.]
RSSYAEGMDDVWIEFDSKVTGQRTKLHGLWLEAENPRPDSPVLLYLHGARWNVAGSSMRMRRMQDLGFGVLAIDYRGFGKSTQALPSEEMAYEDARQAWDWLARQFPDRPRYVFGHSLGGAIAIHLAAAVEDEQGTIVEGTFTSIPDVASSFKWGWLPIGPLITQRFSAIDKVAKVGSPLLVVHGDNDRLIPRDLGKRLYDAATGRKHFVLVEGGSHHNTMWVGHAKYREAVRQLFSLK